MNMNSHDVTETLDSKNKSPRLPRRFGVHFYVKIACVVYVLITIMAFRYWDRSISLYLESVIAEVEAEGGMLDLTGLKPPVLADEDNAVWWYDLAGTKDPFSVFQAEPAEYNNLDEGGEQVLSASEKHLSELSEKWEIIQEADSWKDVISQHPDVSKGLFDLFSEMAECVHRGGQCEASDWGYMFFTFKQWAGATPFDRFSMLRESARRLAFMMAMEAEAGKTAATLKHADSIFAMCRHLDSVYVFIQSLTSMAIDSLVCGTICDTACYLELDSSEDRLAVEAMISYLIKPGQARDFYERCAVSERGFMYNVFQNIDALKEEYLFFKIAYPLGAEIVVNLDMANAMLLYSRCIREFDEKYYDRDRIAEWRGMSDDLVLKSFYALSILDGHVWKMTISNLVSRRLAAISLMLRLYEVDHGHLPDSLAELEGEYITKLSIDPFSPSRSGFIYRRAGNCARIYSVGEDGKDDGGDTNEYNDQIAEYRAEAEDLSDLFESSTTP